MLTRNFIICLAVSVCTIGVVHCQQHTYVNASLLEAALLNNYYTDVRPENLTTVTIDFGLYHITALDIVQQKLSLIGFLLVVWNDPRLSWTPSSYGNMGNTFFTNSKIWVPPLTLANPAYGIQFLSDDSDAASLPIRVTYDGRVIWLAQANFEVYCTVDITYYPFDSQSCSVLITSWMYEGSEISLTNSDTMVNKDLFEENGEWELAKSEVELGIRTLKGHGNSMIKFTLYLNRKYSYYILTMILPNIFLAFIGCLIFYTPTDSGEDKTDMALTILLSLAVLITGVSASIPTTSIHVCILSVYLLCTLAMSSFQILIVVVLQQWNINHESGCTLSPALHTFTKVMAKVLFYRTHEKGDNSISGPTADTTTVENGKKDPRINHTEDIHGNQQMRLANSNSPVAWEKDASGVDNHDIEPYTYRDLTRIMDTFAFYFFLIVTTLMTVCFLAVLAFGDDSY